MLSRNIGMLYDAVNKFSLILTDWAWEYTVLIITNYK